MSTPQDPERDPQERDDEVDLDLDADDVLLREAIGQPTVIRVGGKVITIPHQKEWLYEASQFMGQGMYTAWARRVLDDQDFKAWEAAKLKNYQLEAVVLRCTADAGLTPGKSPARSRSSRSTRRR